MKRTPRYIQRRRIKGWRKPKGVVDCTRPGPLGNPFHVTLGENAEDAVRYFRKWLKRRTHPYAEQRWALLDALRNAHGKDLMCWCKPGASCHVQDVLLPMMLGVVHGCKDDDCGGYYRCKHCRRWVGYCMGAADDIEDAVCPICDNCAAERKVA